MNQKLYFYSKDHGEVQVYTDASDYGIGAYICQTIQGEGVDGKPGEIREYAIGYMSKSLSATEQRWSTIEKECYAILMTFKKFNYILRDIKFHLFTDHRNLLYLNIPKSSKVWRWKLAMQEYNCDVEHIEGELNVMADGFSRLLKDGIDEEEVLLVMINPSTYFPTTSSSGEILPDNFPEELFQIPDDKYDWISSVHNWNMGHMGHKKCISALDSQGRNWKERNRHVTEFIKQCPTCQKMSSRKPQNNPIPFTSTVESPFERIQVDTLQISQTPDKNGFMYCLVFIDCCTRWVDIRPLANLNAETMATQMIRYFGDFGAPRKIQTDNGTQFDNSTMVALEKWCNFTHLLTTPYSSEENGIVERANKEILRHIRAICQEKGIIDSWSIAMPFVKRIMNTTVHEATGYSPAEMVFGPAVNMDRFFIDHSPKEMACNVDGGEWIAKIHQIHGHILSEAQKLIIKNKIAIIEKAGTYKGKQAPKEFLDDTFVLLEYMPAHIPTGAPVKLHTAKKGPFKVVNHKGSVYTLADTFNGKQRDVHVTRLTQFLYDKNRVNPETVAYRDHDVFEIEKVTGHRFTGNKSNWVVKVHYRDEMEEEDKWISWKDARMLTQLHTYLKEKGLERYIPESIGEVNWYESLDSTPKQDLSEPISEPNKDFIINNFTANDLRYAQGSKDFKDNLVKEIKPKTTKRRKN